MRSRQAPGEGDQAHVVLVRGLEEHLVYDGSRSDCEAWLALNADKPGGGEGHFELRDGPPPSAR